MSIPLRVRECFEAFSIEHEGAEEETTRLEDELGRFKIWAGNIAAHRPAHSRRSLEYRLRDSSKLREMVLSLLQDLLIAIQDLRKQLLSRHTLTVNEGLSGEIAVRATHGETGLQQDDVEREDTDMFELSDEGSVGEETLVCQALSEVHDVITCLLRFSMTLRAPSRDDQRRDDPGGVAEAFVAHDTDHVRAKFPEAPDYLTRRLGKTLSKHRQYFRYRREHQKKLHEGLDGGDEGTWEMPSTVATTLPNPTSSLHDPAGLTTESETESAYTATSYAGTSTGDAALRVPPWPLSAQSGSPFECPICFGIIVADSDIAWRQHVFEDLPPYVCLSETCGSAVKSFSRRRDWARHNDTMHNRTWVCPHACAKMMRSPTELRSHLAAEHAHSILPDGVQNLTTTCERTVELDTSRLCPLCTRPCNVKKPWTKHVGHHLEQLALFSLPMELFATDTPDDSDGEPNVDYERSSAAASIPERIELEDIDRFLGDPRSDAVVQRSELPTSDAADPSDKDAVASDMPDPFEMHNMAFVAPVTRPAADERDLEVSKEVVVERRVQKVVMVDKKHDPMAKEIEELRAMIKKEEEVRIAREAKIAADKPMLQIEFRDAIGRKFNFPWHLCKTWQGMEALIKAAFLHVKGLGEHVQERHYDLMGPDGEIFLPQVWDALVKPGMSITMHMWPIPEDSQKSRQESIRPQEYSQLVMAPPQPSERKIVIYPDCDRSQSYHTEQPFRQPSASMEPMERHLGLEIGYEPSGMPEDHRLAEAATLPYPVAERHGEPSDDTSPVTKPKIQKERTVIADWMAANREAQKRSKNISKNSAEEDAENVDDEASNTGSK